MAEENKNATIDPNWTPPGATPPAEEPPPIDKQPDPLDALKKQIDEERQLRLAAERKSNELAQSAHRAQVETADSHLQLVITAIDRVKETNSNLKSAYAEALRAQDYEAAAEIQAEMSTNAAKLLQLENGKAQMESQPKPRAPEPIRTAAADPVEHLASQLTDASAAWVRAHPEFARDPRKYQAMIGAHNIAVSEGISSDTPEYFSRVEGILGVGRKVAPVEENEEPLSGAAKVAERRDTAPPAAPVSRGGANGRSARLTAEEQEMAEASGLTHEEYARNREALKKEGRLH